MTLRFYNGEYRFVLVDTEVHRCTDLVRQMQWRRPSCLSSVNFIALIYLGILCFFAVTPKGAAQNTVAAIASGNTTLYTTEMYVTYTYSSFATLPDISTGSPKNVSCEGISAKDISKICALPNNCSNVTGLFCKWRTDYLDHCKSGDRNCSACVEEFLDYDANTREYFEDYEKVLARYDCDPNEEYSMWKCDDCKKAYGDWLCATQIPYFYEDENGDETEVDPCEEFCERTEARCPYFLPHKPYCGQGTFFCSGPRETARSRSLITLDKKELCFRCDFSKEGNGSLSAEDLGCQSNIEVINITSAASSGAVASLRLHRTGSIYAVLHALNLYILVMWTIAPTVVAGT